MSPIMNKLVPKHQSAGSGEVDWAERLQEHPFILPQQSKLMLAVNALKVCLVSFCCAATFAVALAQTNSQFPASTNVIEPTPTPQTSPLLSPETLFPLPTPVTMVSPTPAPTPLPDGTMPLPLPVMPTPVLQDAKTLSEELNRPIPAPSQFSEPLMKPAEWEFSPAIALPLPTPASTLSATPTPMQSDE
jgi:hypothetical protein